ncbi:MAG: hypothetical protein JW915_02910 [Chitinispirillaceae bacterium]|nr:hypothetical protein [Chitinispirillaceae bacterium]
MKSRVAEKNSDQLKQLFAKNPDSLLFSRVADQYRMEGDIKHAIELCQKGLEVHPEYVTGRIILGRCYIELENYDSAIDEFISICRLDRRNIVAIKMLADIFVKRGETEKAGDLYRLLTQLDPFDSSFKILSSRFDTTGKNDLLDILGIQAPADAVLPEYSSTSEPLDNADNYFDNSAVSDDAAGFENSSGDSSIEQMLSSFAEDVPGRSAENSVNVTGADINNRMNSLFGEENASGSSQIPDEFDTIDDAAEEKNQNLDESGSMQPVSGKDISSRIDELFDIPESNVADTPGIRKDGITEKIYPEDHIADNLNSVVSNEVSADGPDGYESGSVSDHTVKENVWDTVDDTADNHDASSGDNIIPFSNNQSSVDPIDEEFEETLQFDRSMFSRLDDEPEFDELTSANPFKVIGKTGELYQDAAGERNMEHSDDEIQEQSNSDDVSVQYELQSLNYEVHDEDLTDGGDKSTVDNVQLHSPLSTVSEDTVFHGNYQFGELDVDDVVMAESDEVSSGLFSAENFTDKIESVFGDNETKEHAESENTADTGPDGESSEGDDLLSVTGIAADSSADGSSEKQTLETPDFQLSELPDITDSLNEMSDLAIDTDIKDMAISEADNGRRDSGPENTNSDDDLMSLQSEVSQNDADAELPGGDSLENALSFLNLQEDSDLIDSSDLEQISSGDSLMFLQNEDSNDGPEGSSQLIDDVVLPEEDDFDDLISNLSQEQNSVALDELSSDQENIEQSLQSVVLENSGQEDILSADVEGVFDGNDIFNSSSDTIDKQEDSESEPVVNQILETTSEDEGVRNVDIFSNDGLMNVVDLENAISAMEQENEDASISDTGVSLSEPVTDLDALENTIQDNDPLLLMNNDSDIISVEDDDSVVSDMDVLVTSPENEQMTGDDVAEKIQDIFEQAEFGGKRQFIVNEEPVKLIEDDQEYTLDTISGTDNPAMVNLSDETFAENRSEFTNGFQYSEVTGNDHRADNDNRELVLDSEPDETPVLSSESSRNFSDTIDKNSAVDLDASLMELPGSELIKEDEDNAGRSGYSGIKELIIDDADNSQVISGSDVEERLEEFFGKDLLGDSSVISLVPEDEEIEETLIQDFYTISGENTAKAAECEDLDGVDMVEMDRPVEFNGDNENLQLPENETIVTPIDDNSKPESIPAEENKITVENVENEPETISSVSDIDLDVVSGIDNVIVSDIDSDVVSDILPEMVDEENEGEEPVKMAAVQEHAEPVKEAGPEMSLEEKTERFCAGDLFVAENTIQNDTPVLTRAAENQSVKEIDEKDTPYNIPDHVLTPTLADIYFQQGQYQLALQIYSRLSEKDPDNDRLQSRIIEIKTCIEQNQNENSEIRSFNPLSKNDKKSSTRTSMKENPLKSDSRPLAGVRISKKKKNRREQRKKM